MVDLPTLMLAGSFVAFLCGGFLLFSWWHHGDHSAALRWAAGHIATGLGIGALAFGFANNIMPLFGLGLTLILTGPILIWAGVRAFNEAPTHPVLQLGGIAVWLIVFAAVMLGAPEWLIPTVNTAIAVAFNLAAAWELAQSRQERLRAASPAIVLLAIHAAILSMAVPDALMGQMAATRPPPLASLFGVIHFETIVYVVGTTFFFIAMVKEQAEAQQREQAETDALTNLPNRRAFLKTGERLLERGRRDSEPLAVAAFDLDRFKAVNDTFGHAIGDRTLQIFAEVARESLRPNDLVSRIGGEEFAALFPGANRDIGFLMAERIRLAFAQAAMVVDGRELGATVSAGIAVAADEERLDALMERADAALYKAKLRGRDRVEHDGEKPVLFPHLVEVA